MTSDIKTIFDFTSPGPFLRSELEKIKMKKPQYSARAWALSMGQATPTTLIKSIKGDRRPPLKLVIAVSRYLELSEFEFAYFQLMAIGQEHFCSKTFEFLRNTLAQEHANKNLIN